MSVNEILKLTKDLSLQEKKELLGKLSQEVENPMLKMDPYFYERKKHLQKLRNDIKNGKMKIYNFDEFEEEMSAFEKELEAKYAY